MSFAGMVVMDEEIAHKPRVRLERGNHHCSFPPRLLDAWQKFQAQGMVKVELNLFVHPS